MIHVQAAYAQKIKHAKKLPTYLLRSSVAKYVITLPDLEGSQVSTSVPQTYTAKNTTLCSRAQLGMASCASNHVTVQEEESDNKLLLKGP